MVLVLIVKPTGIMGQRGQRVNHDGQAPVYALAGIAALLAGLVVLPHFLKFHHQDFMIFLTINVLVVVSYRLMTLTGEWSLIHIVMMGVGAYTSALLSKSLGVSCLAVDAPGRRHRGLVAALLCFPLFRMTQFYFLIGSFAVGEAIRLAWIYFVKPFGGSSGISSIPSPELLRHRLHRAHHLLLPGSGGGDAVSVHALPHRELAASG